jgi:stage II sporulation protein M
MNLSAALAQLKVMKHYLIASALVFVIGIVLGATSSEQFQAFLDAQLAALKQISKAVEETEQPQWTLFWVIFWNNASKSLLIIALGVFIGVFPLFFLIGNGLLLGYIGAVSVKQDSLWALIKGIVPHGILEIPAIIVASALGLRLGLLILKNLFALVSPARSSKSREQLRVFMKSLVPLAIMLVVILFLAAVIESTVTLWLVKG